MNWKRGLLFLCLFGLFLAGSTDDVHAIVFSTVAGAAAATDMNVTGARTSVALVIIAEANMQSATSWYNQTTTSITECGRNSSTGGNRNVTLTCDLSGLADGNWDLRVGENYTNASGAANATITSVGLDNTNPAINTITLTSPVLEANTQTITVNCTDVGFRSEWASTVALNHPNGSAPGLAATSTQDNWNIAFVAGKGYEFDITCTDQHSRRVTSAKQSYISYQRYPAGIGAKTVIVTGGQENIVNIGGRDVSRAKAFGFLLLLAAAAIYLGKKRR